jgi:hypothetical protein
MLWPFLHGSGTLLKICCYINIVGTKKLLRVEGILKLAHMPVRCNGREMIFIVFSLIPHANILGDSKKFMEVIQT